MAWITGRETFVASVSARSPPDGIRPASTVERRRQRLRAGPLLSARMPQIAGELAGKHAHISIDPLTAEDPTG